MKNKLNIYIVILGKVVVWVLGIAVIIMLLMKLTNHSPTETQILYVMLGGIISYLLIMGYKLGQFVGEVRSFMAISKNSFKKLSRDVDYLMKVSGR